VSVCRWGFRFRDLSAALPVEVRELPGDLAALDVLLDDRALLAPIGEA
jgi:hypothetical protein